MRHRAVTVLLLPLVVLLFMIGWVFYYMGKQHNRGSVEETRGKLSTQQDRETGEEEYFEVGLIEDLAEKTISSDQ